MKEHRTQPSLWDLGHIAQHLPFGHSPCTGGITLAVIQPMIFKRAKFGTWGSVSIITFFISYVAMDTIYSIYEGSRVNNEVTEQRCNCTLLQYVSDKYIKCKAISGI